LAFLNRNLTITLADERQDDEDVTTFYYEGGIKSYVEYMNKSRDVLHNPFYVEGEEDDIVVEVALQYNDGYATNLYSYTNNIHTHEGGTHEVGFRTALTRVINDYARKSNIFKEDDENLTGEDVREGMT